MAKRNWSNSEPLMRKPHALKMQVRTGRRLASDVTVRIDPLFVAAAFAAKVDANRAQFYQPPIVGKSICR